MLKQSNKNGFGNAVGSITNSVTTTFDVFEVTPESLDTALTRINEYVEGIRK